MQFGWALHRILARVIQADPQFRPIYLARLDISNGFCQVWLLPWDIPKLGNLFPSGDNEPDLIGFPMVLPMGWVNFPPLFCAATETVTDLANASLAHTNSAPFH